MKFVTKLVVAVITISATIVGSIWTGFETLDSRMDKKVKDGENRVKTIIYDLKEERNAMIKNSDEKTSIQIAAVRDDINEVKQDVRALLGIARRSQVFLGKESDSLYANRQVELTLRR